MNNKKLQLEQQVLELLLIEKVKSNTKIFQLLVNNGIYKV